MADKIIALDAFVRGYLVCALWSSTDYDGEPLNDNYDETDIAPQCLAGMRADCVSFIDAQMEDLKQYVARMSRDEGEAWSSAGHDFWLTRNGHGAGFWDRGLGELGDRLSAAAKVYQGQDLYVGDDGKLYIGGLENFKED